MTRFKVNAKELRRLIMAKKMTLKAASKFAGVSPMTLSRIMTKDCLVNVQTATKLSLVFGDSMFCEEQTKQQKEIMLSLLETADKAGFSLVDVHHIFDDDGQDVMTTVFSRKPQAAMDFIETR